MEMIDFDPNSKRDPKAPVWATYIPTRRPNFKTHTSLGHAVNAIGYRFPNNEGIIYEFVDNEWVEHDRYERPKNCAHCGSEFPTPSSYYYAKYNVLTKYDTGPKYKKPIVCRPC